MKRSEINREIRNAESFFASLGFRLPRFAFWKPEDWKKHGNEIREITDCCLGWDVTDFGSGDYRHTGLFLFTLRNGVDDSVRYPKRYAEKIMISHSEQVTPMHCHEKKREDIINRGGGNLVFELFNRDLSETRKLASTPVHISRDGELITLKAGEKLILEPGESISITQNLFHKFYAEKGSEVMIGEVSSVNDDHADNMFLNPLPRFPKIDEDEPIYRRLVCDY